MADKLGRRPRDLLDLRGDGAAGSWRCAGSACPQPTWRPSPAGRQLHRLPGSFLVLFAASGIGNGSTFRMIPVIFLNRAGAACRPKDLPSVQALAAKEGAVEAAAALGFAAPSAAYGGFFIPKSYGSRWR
jgi:nitrate/nitrite transporter NarK